MNKAEIFFDAITGLREELVEEALNKIPVKLNPSMEDILEADGQARAVVAHSARGGS